MFNAWFVIISSLPCPLFCCGEMGAYDLSPVLFISEEKDCKWGGNMGSFPRFINKYAAEIAAE